ncbi:MAG: DUF1343 domain-containing protein [Thermodesulfobacteriota bacterium]|nr:DUF1343 domain-containing protein [Thermodesulfobacteriota bacterium]
MKYKVRLGIEKLLEKPPLWLKGKRIGLLVNQASVDSRLQYTHQLVAQLFPESLKALFSPQHGLFGDKQDNMKESPDFIHPQLKIPVFSLYGKTRIPTSDMFNEIDVLIIDIQDVGTRVYTFISTMAHCLKSACQYNKRVIVLDRPNPIGGIMMEGNLLKEKFRSFVGIFPLPIRHGMTVAELACLFNHFYKIGCDLEIIPMEGWKRRMFFADTGLTWVPPSPNMPGPETAMVYPGQVLMEGTNISEGRGTTRPFEIFGAPFIDPFHLKKTIHSKGLKGFSLRELFFQPTFNKWEGEVCGGLQIHITDRKLYKPYFTTLTIIQAIISLYSGQFQWSKPPYEYEYEKMPIDLILGDGDLRSKIEQQEDLSKVETSWQETLINFKEISGKYYLYH